MDVGVGVKTESEMPKANHVYIIVLSGVTY